MHCLSGHPSRSDLIEFAREQALPLGGLRPPERKIAAVQSKLCPECENFVEEQLALTEAMNDLAAEVMAAAPPRIETFWRALPQPPAGRSARLSALKIAAAVAIV